MANQFFVAPPRPAAVDAGRAGAATAADIEALIALAESSADPSAVLAHLESRWSSVSPAVRLRLRPRLDALKARARRLVAKAPSHLRVDEFERALPKVAMERLQAIDTRPTTVTKPDDVVPGEAGALVAQAQAAPRGQWPRLVILPKPASPERLRQLKAQHAAWERYAASLTNVRDLRHPASQLAMLAAEILSATGVPAYVERPPNYRQPYLMLTKWVNPPADWPPPPQLGRTVKTLLEQRAVHVVYDPFSNLSYGEASYGSGFIRLDHQAVREPQQSSPGLRHEATHQNIEVEAAHGIARPLHQCAEGTLPTKLGAQGYTDTLATEECVTYAKDVAAAALALALKVGADPLDEAAAAGALLDEATQLLNVAARSAAINHSARRQLADGTATVEWGTLANLSDGAPAPVVGARLHLHIGKAGGTYDFEVPVATAETASERRTQLEQALGAASDASGHALTLARLTVTVCARLPQVENARDRALMVHALRRVMTDVGVFKGKPAHALSWASAVEQYNRAVDQGYATCVS